MIELAIELLVLKLIVLTVIELLTTELTTELVEIAETFEIAETTELATELLVIVELGVVIEFGLVLLLDTATELLATELAELTLVLETPELKLELAVELAPEDVVWLEIWLELLAEEAIELRLELTLIPEEIVELTLEEIVVELDPFGLYNPSLPADRVSPDATLTIVGLAPVPSPSSVEIETE